MRRLGWIVLLTVPLAMGGKKKPPEPSPIDRYIAEASRPLPNATSSPGSLYSDSSRLSDLARDVKASQVNDIVTIVVSDKASAVSRGATNASRKSAAEGSISSVAGIANKRLSGLASMSGSSDLKGQGETSRESELTTTLSARVTHVLPNGNMVIEGTKNIAVNSEHQSVSVRGVIRWNDLTPSNMVRSDRITNLEIRVNGKGVVADAVRRPNILYRVLLGVLPF